MNNILNTDQVAEKLGITTEAVRRLLRDGLLKGFKIGSSDEKRHWRVKEEDLGAFINGNNRQVDDK